MIDDLTPPSPSAINKPDLLPVMVRGIVPPPPPPPKPPSGGRKQKPGDGSEERKPVPPSEWTLVFDCETKVDASQNLRFGTYQIRKGPKLMESGVFYDPDTLTSSELELLRHVADERGVKVRTHDEFVDQVYYGIAYEFRANIVGFNLPFDLSRLAVWHHSAHGKTMKGGFSLKLSNNSWKPRVQVRHLNSRAALMQFALPAKQKTPRGARRRKIFTPGRRGSFIDLKTIAAALFSRSFNLASLAAFLKTPSQKHSADEHGARLIRAYVDYAFQDTQVTWECYEALVEKYALHQLSETHLGKVLSEASLGKAYLRQMGIKPFREVQPDFPDHLTGIIMSTYFGGRSEVRWRREIKQVLYCDFMSMYPTVCTLMGLWRFVIAKGVTWRDATEETRALLENVTLADLQKPDVWRELTTLVRLSPADDILPVRAKYDSLMPGAQDGAASATIGLNYLCSADPLWQTLAEVIASKLLTGKTPEILEAIRFEPLEPQDGLKPVTILGKTDYRVNPYKDDFFKRVIDLRLIVDAQLISKEGQAKEELKAEKQALKILANSTSYGIFVELIVGELDKFETRTCYGASGVGFPVATMKSEEPGRCFHPLLATLITGAARLMLAIAEQLTIDKGLDWVFCDTDSMAIAKPEGISSEEFFTAAKGVREWFDALNPYECKGPLFKIEKPNYGLGSNTLAPLYCLAISSKRYVLFNLDANGVPVIRKASAHGLGHLLAPYGSDDAPASVPAPALDLSDIGVERWQYDLWYQIIRAELDGHSDQVDLPYHEALGKPAASRYGATTPKLLRWFKTYNQNRAYRDQVKPFNFLLSFQNTPRLKLLSAEETAVVKKGRRPRARRVNPVACFNKDVIQASRDAFDRETGKFVPIEELKTYREALAQYHLSAESKFLNGDHDNRGRTERRYVWATGVIHIGKEADKWEEQYFTGPDENAVIEYGVDASEGSLDFRLQELCAKLKERATANLLGVSRVTLRKALKEGSCSLSWKVRERIARNAPMLTLAVGKSLFAEPAGCIGAAKKTYPSRCRRASHN
jgi:hypothetical protein